VHHARCHRREILLTIEVSEAGEHPRLRQRGFSDTRIAEKDRKFFGGRFQRSDHFDGLAPSAKEKVRVGFGHGGKTAIRRGVPPKFAGKRAPPAAASITWMLFSDAGSAPMINAVPGTAILAPAGRRATRGQLENRAVSRGGRALRNIR
jgi:hypothetical protein